MYARRVALAELGVKRYGSSCTAAPAGMLDEMEFDARRYGELLAAAQPALIETAEEHERLLSAAESLMERRDSLSIEEEKLLTLLVLLIEAYESTGEDGGEPAELPAPHHTLQRLLDARGLSLEDITHIFGNPQAAREVIDGRQTITRGQAKQLGKFFQAPARLFEDR